jgi:outer membrane protein TolC
MKRFVFLSLFLCFFLFSSLTAATAAQEEAAAAKAPPARTLTLPECVTIALDASPQILASQADIIEKEYSLQGIRKDLYPSLYFNYDYRYSPDAYFPFGIENYYSYAFSVQQPLYRGRSLVTGVELGELALESSRTTMEQVRNDITLAVHVAYYNLLKANRFEEVAEQSLEERKAHLKDARAFFNAGLIPKNEMLQSEVLLANSEIELIRAKNFSVMALARLNTLLRNPVDSEIVVEDILEFEPSDISWQKSVEQAKERRPELLRGEIAVTQADRNIAIARAPYLPAVTVSANYLKQGDDLIAADYPIGPSDVKTVMATLEWRFWAWGQGRDKVAAARQTMKKAQESQGELLDNIILQVREAFLDTREAEYNIGVTEKAIEQAEEDFRINESRYKAQLSTTTDVLDAQTRLTRAKIEYYNALYSYRISLMRLAWATGTLNP